MNTLQLFGQVVVHGGGGWTIGTAIIAIIVIAACIGIMYVALQKFGVEIPDFVVKIFWIIVVAVVAIMAIRFLLSLTW